MHAPPYSRQQLRMRMQRVLSVTVLLLMTVVVLLLAAGSAAARHHHDRDTVEHAHGSNAMQHIDPAVVGASDCDLNLGHNRHATDGNDNGGAATAALDAATSASAVVDADGDADDNDVGDNVAIVRRVPTFVRVEYRWGVGCRGNRQTEKHCQQFRRGFVEERVHFSPTKARTGNDIDEDDYPDRASWVFNTTENKGVPPVRVAGGVAALAMVSDRHDHLQPASTGNVKDPQRRRARKRRERFFASGLVVAVEPHGNSLQLWSMEGQPFRMEIPENTRTYGKRSDFEWVAVTVFAENEAATVRKDAAATTTTTAQEPDTGTASNSESLEDGQLS